MQLSTKEETLMAFFSLMQSVLLASFAAILGAHRSEILDKTSSTTASFDEQEMNRYDPPSAKA
jgi:hypothetical protein